MDKKKGRPKERPELENINLGLNPLIDEEGYEFKFKVKRGSYDVTNKFDLPDKKEYFRESTPFTKVYEVAGFKDTTKELPVRAKELLLYIIMYVESGQDIIWINRKEYMADNGIKSVNTFKTAIEELANKRYVCPHIKIKDLLWINPKYLFKGDRIAKYPNNVEIIEDKKKK